MRHVSVPPAVKFACILSATWPYDGKPRGTEEMYKNIESLGLKKGWVLVSDKWKATLAAIKRYREIYNISPSQLPHEVVNHSAGEIVNERGFTTNLIESKWSSLKRWVRARCGGKLPNSTDRSGWKLWIGEYQFRKYMKIPTKSELGHMPVDDPLRATAFLKCCEAVAAYKF